MYESLKQSRGGDRGNQYTKVAKGQNDPLAKPKISTAQKVAEKTGVSEKTIKRDAKYAESVDQIASKAGVSPQEVLTSGLSKKQAQEVSKKSPEVIRQKLVFQHCNYGESK